MTERLAIGVLDGDDSADDLVSAWTAAADVVLAADGAANRLLLLGVVADACIGDFDSISPAVKARQRRLVEAPSQDESDCDKLLEFARSDGLDDIVLIGAEGTRVDHFLATLFSARRSKMRVSLAFRMGLGWVIVGPAKVELTPPAGRTISLVPLERCSDVTMQGVRWPFESCELCANGLVSLSNVVAKKVVVCMGSGAALLTVAGENSPQASRACRFKHIS